MISRPVLSPVFRLFPLVLVSLVAAVLTASVLTSTAWAATAKPIQHQLPAQPTARVTAKLREVWRRGGEGDEELMLGVVARGVMDGQGNTYLLDRQLCQVVVIGPDGELVGILGREGAGPGEFEQPSDLFLMDQGRVGVTQGFPGQVVILNPDGTPGGSIVVGDAAGEGGFFFMRGAAMRGGHLVAHSGRAVFDREDARSTNVSTLALLDRDGREVVRFAEKTQVQNYQHPSFDEAESFSELNSWALAKGMLGDGVRDDLVLYTHPSRDEYVLNAYDMTGRLRAVFRRDFTPRVRTDEELKEMGTSSSRRRRGREITMERHMLDTDPAIVGLDAAPDGSLYVTSCFGRRSVLPEGVARLVDVISPDGKTLTELRLELAEFDQEQDTLLFLDGRHWLLIRNFDSARDAMGAGDDAGAAAAGEDQGEPEPLEVVL